MLSLLNLPQEIAVGIDKASGNGRGARYEAEGSELKELIARGVLGYRPVGQLAIAKSVLKNLALHGAPQGNSLRGVVEGEM